MSNGDAKPPELAKVVGIFTSLGLQEVEEKGQSTHMEVNESSEVKEYRGEVTRSSILEEEMAEMDFDDDKDDQEAENYIQFLFDPEVPDFMLNEDVIGEIGKFLDYEDLKSLRQVDKLWSSGATPVFVRKSAFVLRSGRRNEEKLEAFEKETKDLKGMTTLKISFNLEYGFEKEAELFNNILAHLSPILMTFELKVLNYNIFIPRASIKFPALRSFSVDSDYEFSVTMPFFQFVYASAPNLTELVVPTLDSAPFSPRLTDEGSACSLPLKLNSLRVIYSYSSVELSTSTCLSKFPQSLKSLDIGARPGTFELLAKLLESNRDCLVSLSLRIDMTFSEESQQTFRFRTTFSKLQKLKVIFRDQEDIIFYNNIFEGEGVNYCKIFPNLKSLSVFSYYINSEMCAGIWAFLFPPQVFKGLQFLKLTLIEDCTAILDNAGIAEDWAERIFPNARIKIINLI